LVFPALPVSFLWGVQQIYGCGRIGLQNDDHNTIGVFPQLFAFDKDTDQLRYLGGYDWLDGQTITSLALILE
jgi:hypothetical protein